jgi:hypothetical protein
MTASTSSVWPWMKDFAVAIAEKPIPPATENDRRPSVQALIGEHRQLIDKVAAELKLDPLYDVNKHDDLWIVRFLLSHSKKLKPTVMAAKFTLAFREEHKLDEKDIRYCPLNNEAPSEPFKRFLKYCKEDTFRFGVPDPTLGVIGFLNISGIDQHAIVKHVDEADWLPTFMYISEWSHQWLDFITRTTGRLTKSIRLVDASTLTLGSHNPENFKRDENAMAIMEDCYPQMLQTIFICHPPAWIQIPWRILRPLMPKRVSKKMDFISPGTNKRELKRVVEHISLDHLPARFGGRNETWPVEFPVPSTGR